MLPAIIDASVSTLVHGELWLPLIGAASASDPRLNDARAPLGHQHSESDTVGLVNDLLAAERVANRGLANGYAGLDPAGRVPSGQLPAYPPTPDAIWTDQNGDVYSDQDGNVLY